jgi:phosphatidylserine synthase
MPENRTPLNRGFGRVLVFVYGVCALSASARAGVQIATKFDEAPLAFGLSALAALVYIVATVALARSSATSRRVAWLAVGFELLGVLAVGTASVVDGKAFPEPTVWSDYGQGYGYVPLVLPFIGLFWLWRTSRQQPVAESTAAKG